MIWPGVISNRIQQRRARINAQRMRPLVDAEGYVIGQSLAARQRFTDRSGGGGIWRHDIASRSWARRVVRRRLQCHAVDDFRDPRHAAGDFLGLVQGRGGGNGAAVERYRDCGSESRGSIGERRLLRICSVSRNLASR